MDGDLGCGFGVYGVVELLEDLGGEGGAGDGADGLRGIVCEVVFVVVGEGLDL